MPSFYCPDISSTIDEVSLEGEEFHHLVHVMRHKVGDLITLNSGTGWLATGEVCQIGKTKAIIQIKECKHEDITQRPYAIAFSLLRSKNDEWLVEKVTELGANFLFPIVTEYSVRNPSSNTLERFRKSALAAIKQCNNPYLPEIYDITSLETSLQKVVELGFQPVLASERRPEHWLDSLKADKPYCFFVGPEGGFSPSEFALFLQAGAQEITLSSHILRAETAAIAIAAQYSLTQRFHQPSSTT